MAEMYQLPSDGRGAEVDQEPPPLGTPQCSASTSSARPRRRPTA